VLHPYLISGSSYGQLAKKEDWQVFPDPGSCHDLAAAPLADGRLALFVIDEHDKILICYKTTTDPNSAWSGWRDLFPISP
jgi:hypothetical protein